MKGSFVDLAMKIVLSRTSRSAWPLATLSSESLAYIELLPSAPRALSVSTVPFPACCCPDCPGKKGGQTAGGQEGGLAATCGLALSLSPLHLLPSKLLRTGHGALSQYRHANGPWQAQAQRHKVTRHSAVLVNRNRI